MHVYVDKRQFIIQCISVLVNHLLCGSAAEDAIVANIMGTTPADLELTILHLPTGKTPQMPFRIFQSLCSVLLVYLFIYLFIYVFVWV